LIDIEDKE